MSDPAKSGARAVLEWKIKNIKAMLQVSYVTGNVSRFACVLPTAAFLGCYILEREPDVKCNFPVNIAAVVLEAIRV